MTDTILLLKLIHILGATVLFGTGLGIAFFMFMAHRSREPCAIAHTAGTVVIADAVFTASAVILQPVTGVWLALDLGYRLTEPWILLTFALYVTVGLCWLPVVWIQVRLRDLARDALLQQAPLPKQYDRLFRVWFWLGWPAFGGVLLIFVLMIWRPQF